MQNLLPTLADQGFYLKNALNEDTPGYIQECDLRKDPDAEETSQWGSFYLHPDLTKFYKPEELYLKSDSELEELMKAGRE